MRIIRQSQSKPWAPGKMQFDMSFLPPRMGLDAIHVVMEGTLDVPAAGVTSDQLTRFLDGIECERRLRSSGLGLSVMDWMLSGRDLQRPADIAVNPAAPVELFWAVSWRDTRGTEALRSPPATDFYIGRTLDLYFSRSADLVPALSVNSGTEVYLECHLSPLAPRQVSHSTVMNYVSYDGKEVYLPGGLSYLDIVIAKNDGAAITAAEVGNVRLTADGATNFLERERLGTLVRSFNRHLARGAQVQGATDGVEGEALDLGSVPFVPVLHPVPPYIGAGLPSAKKQMVLALDGTLAPGSARVFYRGLEHRDEANVAKARKRVWGA